MRDLKLDLTTGDLLINNYDMVVVDEIDQIAQSIHIKLRTYKGEFFADTSAGMDYFNLILIKNPDMDIVATTIKEQILSVEGVREIIEYSQDLNNALRTLTVTFKVDTIYGDITQELEV